MTTRRRLQRRLTNPAVLVLVGVLALAVLWVLAPCWERRTESFVRGASLSKAEAVQFRAAVAVMGAWLFFFGASVGSFLNVVVWRLPRGETLIWRPSRCPRCGSGIRPADNVPVFGWLKLRGRCRVCRTPISARYPIVELTMGLMFLGLAIPELFLGGVNLPMPRALRHDFGASKLLEIRGEFVALYAFHCILLSVLLSWVLIERDRQKVPFGYVFFVGLIGHLAPVIAAIVASIVDGEPANKSPRFTLYPIPALCIAMGGPNPWGWLRLLAEPLVGGLVGLTLGLHLLPASRGLSAKPRIPAALTSVGIYLGWQSATSIALLTSGALLFAALWRPAFLERWLLGFVLGAALIHLASWRLLANVGWWPGTTSSFLTLIAVCVIAFGLASFAGGIASARRPWTEA